MRPGLPNRRHPPLDLEAKRQAIIGHIYVDRSRCIPWVDARNCIVCEEMCPAPEKAIILEDAEVRNPNRRHGDGTAAGCHPRAVHRLWHLREPLPPQRPGGHPRLRPHGAERHRVKQGIAAPGKGNRILSPLIFAFLRTVSIRSLVMGASLTVYSAILMYK